MPGSEPFNFLNTDFGQTQGPAGFSIPQLVKKPHKIVPELEALFQVQTNLVKAINAFKADQDDAGKLAVEHAYRTIRNWLEEHG